MRRIAEAALLAAAALAGCGDAPQSPSQSTADTLPTQETARAATGRAPRSVHALISAQTDERTLAFEAFAEYRRLERLDRAGVEDFGGADAVSAALEGILDTLRGLGPAAIPALIRGLEQDSEWDQDFTRILIGLRDAAVLPICEHLDACEDRDTAERLIDCLGDLSTVWARGPDNERVQQSLLRWIEAEASAPADRPRRGHTDVAAFALYVLVTAPRVPSPAIIGRLAALYPDAAGTGLATELLLAFELLGSAAAPLAPALIAELAANPEMDEEEQLRRVRILTTIASAAPEALPALRELLRSDDLWQRHGAARIVRAWGGAGVAADPELLALLHSADGRLQRVAALALKDRPGGIERVWRAALSVSLADGVEEHYFPDDQWSELLSDSRIARRVLAAVPGLRATDVGALEWLLEPLMRRDLPALVSALASAPVPEVRALLSEMFFAGDLPPEFVALASHEDDIVRACVAAQMLGTAEERAESAHETLVTLAASSNVVASRIARQALEDARQGPTAQRDKWIVELQHGSEWRVHDAVHALAADDDPITGVSPERRDLLARTLIDDTYRPADMVSVLLRLDGGLDAIRRAIDAQLDTRESRQSHTEIVTALRYMGADAGPMCDALIARTAGSDDSSLQQCHEHLVAVAAWIKGDMGPYALSTYHDAREAVGLLRGEGAVGARALVLYTGRDADLQVYWLVRESPPPELANAIRAAARPSGTDEHAEVRRVGAAWLGALLPDAEAVPLLGEMVHAGPTELRFAALVSLIQVARRAPERVSPNLLEPAFADADCVWPTVFVAHALGARAAPFTERLRDLLDGKDAPLRIVAGATHARATGDPEIAAAVIRELLAERGRPLIEEVGYDELRDESVLGTADDTDQIRWALVAEVLLSAAPQPTDVKLVLDVIPPGDFQALMPIFARHGEAAAPAVPLLRKQLATLYTHYEDGVASGSDDGDTYPRAESAAQILGAIGAAASPALPDLRRWVALSGDVHGVGRAAIRAIEAAE